MKYPTLKEVEAADHKQLATWHRFLPSPGANVAEEDRGTAKYDRIQEHEIRVLAYLSARLQDLGGWSPELSKEIGFEKPLNVTSTPTE